MGRTDFHHIATRAEAVLSTDADGTCRVLAAGLEILDAGRSCGGGKPPETIR